MNKMAIADVTVIPIGTNSPSISSYVAELHDLLTMFEKEGKIRFQLTPMNTIIEGELKDLFVVIQAIHEAPFQKGVHRVATNIRIDDRRDKKRKMEEKLESVRAKLKEK
jgi:uncharacterized protein (TIGR00106 family)